MRKWAVIYSSASGNTKTIAEEIAGTAGADLFPIQNAPTDLSAYEVVALGEGCEILGTFSAQGKLAPALIERRKKSDPDDTHNSPEAQERWVRAAEHPNEEDRAAAREFVHRMEHKMDLLEKFLKAQEAKKRVHG